MIDLVKNVPASYEHYTQLEDVPGVNFEQGKTNFWLR